MTKVETIFGSYMTKGAGSKILEASGICTSILRLRRDELVQKDLYDDNIEPVSRTLDMWLYVEKQFKEFLKDK